MMDLLGGSKLLGLGRRFHNHIKETARQSILLGQRDRIDTMEHSRLAAMMNRVHPVENIIGAMRKSGILSWLYQYSADLCVAPIRSLLYLLLPLFGLLAVRMLVAGRWLMAGGLLLVAGLCFLLFSGKDRLVDWLRGSLIGRYVPFPEGEVHRSVTVYLYVAGMVGGIVGWIFGVVLGVAAAVLLAAVPIVFGIPPMVVTCALFALLPLLGTSLCWGLSILLVVCYFFARTFGTQKGKPIDGMDLLLMIFPLFCAVSAAFSFDRADSLKVVFMWLGLFACVPFVRRIIDCRARLAAVLWSFTAGAVASGLYGLFQYFSGMVNTTWTDTALFDDIQLRVYSTFANPNVYGEFLLIALPLVAGFALYCTGWKRWLLLAADLLLMVNMVMTYSRGCYVGIALTALVFMWHFSKKWTVAALALGVPLAILVMPQSVVNRILSIGNMEDSSTSYRMMIYIGTLLMLVHYWMGGVGIGEKAFNVIYPYYALSGIIAPHSHSLFFQMAVSFGVAGLIYLLVLWFTYQRRMVSARKNVSSEVRPLMLGFGAVFWGLMVQSAFDYTWYNYRVFQLFWLVIVLGFAAAEKEKKQ